MKSQSLLLLVNIFFFLVPHTAFSQDRDSLAFAHAEPTKKKIKNGIHWHRVHSEELFESVQEINWIEIDLKKHQKNLHLAADSTQLKTTSTFAHQQQALVAINGGFFDMKNGGSVDYIRADDELVNGTQKPSDRANAVLQFGKQHLSIENATSENTEGSPHKNVLLSGPLLLENAEIVQLDNNPFNSNRHPRTAIGITNRNTLIMIVVDGRNSHAHGMNLQELSKIMKWLNVRQGMNLDGGGSSTMYIQGATQNNIVNHPSDNKKFDHHGERAVANILYLK